MKHRILAIAGALCAVAATETVRADSTWVYAVQITANAQPSPPSITLSWQPDPSGANSYNVYRKRKNETSWNQLSALPGSASTFVDQAVAAGDAFEYQIVKAGSLGYTGYGYIYAGIQAPFVERRGKVILVVDNTVDASLAGELNRLRNDLVGDGWTVVRRDVGRTDNPANVRGMIIGEYNADPSNVRAVFLFGHVPIFRCGNLNVDGHQARPMPADAFYGDVDVDCSWGDPSFLPSDVELMVGRVDFWNMPGQGAPAPWPSEVELLRNYLNKDHRWRHKAFNPPVRALIGDRFGVFEGEAFAASGFRNIEPLVGPNRTDLADERDGAPDERRWSTLLAGGAYLWAYGCGGGGYTSMSAMGTHGIYSDVLSTDLVAQDAKAVFFMMLGSWLGEWDSADNIMRAALATPSLGLTCSWAGRPHWFYHHMGLGEPIGYSARLTMNNAGLYSNQVNQFTRGVHIALMGDPTLRLHAVAPPSNLSGSSGTGNVQLTWSAAPDSVLGYHVYRARNMADNFARVSGTLVGGTGFTDSTASSGTYVYMVRAIKLQNSPSGTYFNASQGIFETVTVGGTPPPPPSPIISSATITSNTTTVRGFLNSSANTTVGLDFYASPACDPSGHGEGRTYLGETNVTTDAGGNADYCVMLPATTPGSVITATATHPPTGTSEFSACEAVIEAPLPRISIAYCGMGPTQTFQIRWPSYVVGWWIATTTNLNSPIWVTIPNPQVVVDGTFNTFTYTNSAADRMRFFRLVRP